MCSARLMEATRRSPCGSRSAALQVLISRGWSARCTLRRGAFMHTSAALSRNPRRRRGRTPRTKIRYPQAEGRSLMSLGEGDRVPEFAMPTDDGGTLSAVNLQGKTTVLYFYPRDDTPGCTTEAQE